MAKSHFQFRNTNELTSYYSEDELLVNKIGPQ